MRKSLSVLASLFLVFGLATATMSRPAHAGRDGFGVGLAAGALLGLGIAGAYAGPRYYGGPAYYAGPGPGCYPGPRQCGWTGRSCWYNRFGEQVCRGGGEWRCWRPTICD